MDANQIESNVPNPNAPCTIYPDLLIANALLHNDSVTEENLGDMAWNIRVYVDGISPVLHSGAIQHAIDENAYIFKRSGNAIASDFSLTQQEVDEIFNESDLPQPQRTQVKSIVEKIMMTAYQKTDNGSLSAAMPDADRNYTQERII